MILLVKNCDPGQSNHIQMYATCGAITDPDALFADTSAACVEFLFEVHARGNTCMFSGKWSGMEFHHTLYWPH